MKPISLNSSRRQPRPPRQPWRRSPRTSSAPTAGVVCSGGEFGGRRDARAVMAQRVAERRGAGEVSQPIRERTGGSTFANPPGHQAWQLIDAAGCRGLARGAAMVSQKHTNFLINTGNATAADIEGLGEEVRQPVY